MTKAKLTAGAKLRRFRELAGQTLAGVAVEVGCAESTIRALEHNDKAAGLLLSWCYMRWVEAAGKRRRIKLADRPTYSDLVDVALEASHRQRQLAVRLGVL